MANFEEFSVTRRKNPSRFGMLGALVVFSVFMLNYRGPAATPSDARMFVPGMFLAERTVPILDQEGTEILVNVPKRAPDSVTALGPGSAATGDQCIGAAVVLAVPLRLFGPAGAHLLYAVIPALLSLLMYGMTARVFGRRWLAFCAQLLAAVNPLMLSYQSLHPAFIAATLVAAIMYLLVDPARHFLLLGMLFGALVSVENEALVFAPVILLMLATDRRAVIPARLTDGVFALLGFILALAPALYWKELAFGSILVHPRQVLPGGGTHFSHRVFGWQFHSAALFNFPMQAGVVRTPHFPFPTFLGMPMALARGFGLFFVATFFMGIGPLHREDRRLARFFVALVMVTFLWWGFQENWDERRMAVAMLIVPAAVLLMSAGLLRFARISTLRSNVFGLAVVTCVLLAMIKGTLFMEFPVDPRWNELHPDAVRNLSGLDGLDGDRRLEAVFHTTSETRDELELEKARFTAGNLLPRAYLPTRWTPGESLRRFLDALLAPDVSPAVPRDLLAPRSETTVPEESG